MNVLLIQDASDAVENLEPIVEEKTDGVIIKIPVE